MIYLNHINDLDNIVMDYLDALNHIDDLNRIDDLNQINDAKTDVDQ